MTCNPSLRRSAVFVALVLASLAASFGPTEAAPALPHPHFPKVLTCRVKKGVEITLRYQTATFDGQGAKKMKVGAAWHLAGAVFETSSDLLVGGREVEAGSYALSARKTAKGFELTMHDGRGFSLPDEHALVLKGEFDAASLRFEHLNLDVQPGGDKEHTELFLDARFDTMLARVKIEIPE